MFKMILAQSALVVSALIGSAAQAQWFDPCNAFYTALGVPRRTFDADSVERTGGSSVASPCPSKTEARLFGAAASAVQTAPTHRV